MKNKLLPFLLFFLCYNYCFTQLIDSDSIIKSITKDSSLNILEVNQSIIKIDSNISDNNELRNNLIVENNRTNTNLTQIKTSERIYKDILLAIKVVEKNTNIPQNAIVQTISHPHTKGQGICNDQGKFHFNINNYSKIELRISKRGFHTHIDTIDMVNENFDGNIYTKIYTIIPFKKGDIVSLDNVYFKQGDDHLLPNSYPAIDKLAEMMNTNNNITILIGGHTENKGSKHHLVELSKRRVNSVRFYLLQKGIKLNRIKTIGYGASKPIYHGSDTEKQKMNRRVDFKIIKT